MNAVILGWLRGFWLGVLVSIASHFLGSHLGVPFEYSIVAGLFGTCLLAVYLRRDSKDTKARLEALRRERGLRKRVITHANP